MAGHSHASNVMHKKNAQDKKKAKIFTKAIRDINTALRHNHNNDPELNSKLKIAIIKAKSVNVPKDKIENALNKYDEKADNLEEIRYNATFKDGIVMIIELLTDNKNRTASDIRSLINKHNGELVSTGSVEFMFDKIGRIILQNNIAEANKMFELCIENGADSIENINDQYIIETKPEKLNKVFLELNKNIILDKYLISMELFWKAKHYITLSDKNKIEKINEIIDLLKDYDDVEEVYRNYANY